MQSVEILQVVRKMAQKHYTKVPFLILYLKIVRKLIKEKQFIGKSSKMTGLRLAELNHVGNMYGFVIILVNQYKLRLRHEAKENVCCYYNTK